MEFFHLVVPPGDDGSIHHYHRAYGRSQFFNLPRLWRTGTDILSFWWQLRVRGLPSGEAAVHAPEGRRGGAR